MNNQVNHLRPNIALIGCGPISNFHVDAARGAGLEITDVAASPNSINVSKFASKHNIPGVWMDPFELIENGTWDGLLIAATTPVTMELLKFAMRRGLPILVEKPVTLESALFDSIDTNAKNVMVGYNRRFYPSFQEMKNILSTQVDFMINVEIPEKLTTNELDRHFPFTGVRLNSVHVFDLVRYLVGPLDILSIENLRNSKGNEAAVMVMRSHRGHLINIIINYEASANFKIILDDGSTRYHFSPLEQADVFEGMQLIEPTKEFPLRRYSPILKSSVRSDPSETHFKPGFLGQAMAFRKMILGQESTEHATLLDARKALLVAEMVTSRNSEVSLPLTLG